MNARTGHNRGLTLLELLVVIFIISILMAVAIPVFRPPMDTKAVREGARMVNSALAIARTKALETRRPWGVMFEPLPNSQSIDTSGTNFGAGSVTLHYVDVPPPYAGDTTASRLIVRNVVLDPADSRRATLTVEVQPGEFWTDTDVTTQDNVLLGDSLRLNFQGHRYLVEGVSVGPGANTYDLVLYSDTVIVWPREVDPSSTEPSQAFQFTHRPKKAALAPVPLPNRSVVDIAASGVGDTVFTPSVTNPVIITFAPNGQVDLVYHADQPFGARLYDALHLMIGKPGAYGADNLMDLENIWVSVGGQAGQVKSSENAPDDFDANPVRAARTYARSGQGMGG